MGFDEPPAAPVSGLSVIVAASVSFEWVLAIVDDEFDDGRVARARKDCGLSNVEGGCEAADGLRRLLVDGSATDKFELPCHESPSAGKARFELDDRC